MGMNMDGCWSAMEAAAVTGGCCLQLWLLTGFGNSIGHTQKLWWLIGSANGIGGDRCGVCWLFSSRYL